jgi:hypothetical protein
MSYPNGHKEWLENHAGSAGTTKNAVCHAALYLGRVMEVIAWLIGRSCANKPQPPEWWYDVHGDPMD